MADTVGILAYGSLIGDPGPEIEALMFCIVGEVYARRI